MGPVVCTILAVAISQSLCEVAAAQEPKRPEEPASSPAVPSDPAAAGSRPEMSADEIAKELANPVTSLASLNLKLEYRTYRGDLPHADSQDSWSLLFQPVFPFPLANDWNLIARPAFPILLQQPVLNADGLDFRDEGIDLGDTTSDLLYGKTDEKRGLLYGVGAVTTLPTHTDEDVGKNNLTLGPEALFAVIGEWGLAGALVGQQWDIAKWDDHPETSLTTMQYFCAFQLGKGWQFLTTPTISHDWEADEDDKWSVPIGAGIARTVKIGRMPIKFALEAQYYVAQPDTFSPEWYFNFKITPVIANPFLGLFQ
jgi:hypothetical protein